MNPKRNFASTLTVTNVTTKSYIWIRKKIVFGNFWTFDTPSRNVSLLGAVVSWSRDYSYSEHPHKSSWTKKEASLSKKSKRHLFLELPNLVTKLGGKIRYVGLPCYLGPILWFFFRRKIRPQIGVFESIKKVILMKKIGFWDFCQLLRWKLKKIAENGDHNIGPWPVYTWVGIKKLSILYL
jgi:hypothetical protein